jgi:DNA polymerase III sliding clamp (beta) subunit (PCNA family)
MSSLLNNQDGTLIMYSFFDYPNDLAPVKLNLPDLNRLIKILNCIETEDIELKIESNNIKYTSKSIRFTYHLLHEGIIPQCPISVEKIKAIDYQTNFYISASTLVDIVKSSSFVTDIESTKIYISIEEGEVFGELTDKSRANVDSIKLKISDSFKGIGIPKAIPLKYETMRIITTSRCEGVNVYVNNSKSVVTYDVTNDNVKNLYISSGLTG